MLFEESDLLKALPEQFFLQVWLLKLMPRWRKAQMLSISVRVIPTNRPMTILLRRCVFQRKNPASHKYSQFRGNRPFKEAAASFYKKHYGVNLDAEREICVMGGAKIGLVELPLALMNPGDLLLLPDPGYPDYLSGVSLGRVTYETFPLTAENDFLPDLDAIPEETARRAKFIYINYPNNPTGAVATKAFL